MTLVTNTATAVVGDPAGKYVASIAQFLRPNNTTAYTALDVISQTGAAAALVFPGCTRSGAIRNISLTNRLETDTITPRLYIFDAEPTNIADNAAFALVTADIPKLVSVFDFVDADKILIGTLINFYTPTGDADQATGVRLSQPVPYTNATGSLYGLLTTTAGYTPIALTEWTIKLGLEIR